MTTQPKGDDVSPALIGRDKERVWLTDLLQRTVDGSGGSILFAGEAGIGKTALLDLVARQARSSGFVLRSITGAPSESELPYAALHALLAPDARSGHLGDVLETAVGIRQSDDAPLTLAVAAALVSHLSALAENAPLLVVVDDVQWIDPSSANVLMSCAAQLLADRVAMVFAQRSRSGASPDEPDFAREETNQAELAMGRIDVQRLGPLSPVEGVDVLVALGMSRPLAEELSDLAAGSPLALVELARQRFAGERRRPQFSVPDAYSMRIANLSDEARWLCSLLALEDDVAALRNILGGALPILVQEAMDSGILEPGPREEGDLRFVHPLLRAASIAAVSPNARRDLHRQLASAMHGSSQLDRIAAHRSAAAFGVDDEVADLMEQFALRAEGRGALEEAARAALRAAELSSSSQQRVRRMLRGAELRYYSGDTDGATRLARRIVGMTTDPTLRSEAELMVGKASEWVDDPGRTVRELRRLARDLRDDLPSLATRALTQSSAMAFLAGDVNQGIADGLEAIELAERTDDALGAFVARAHVGWNLFLAGRTTEANDLLAAVEPAMRSVAENFDSVDGLLVSQRLAMQMLMREDWSDAKVLLAGSLSGSRRRGMRLSAALLGAVQGVLSWREGRWDEAYSLATADLDPARIPPVSFSWLSAVAAQIAASTGREQEAEQFARNGIASSAQLSIPLVSAWSHAALGHLELSRGRAIEALPSFDRVHDIVTKMGLLETGFFVWHGDYLEALIASGQLDDAHRFLDELRVVADETGRMWAHGIVARTTGMLSVAAIERDDAFERALAIFRNLGMPFEVARTLLARGRYREQRVAAIGDLDDAEALFGELGADLWAAQAAAHRRRLGGVEKPARITATRPLYGLSPAETTVALCAASGATNREIAAELHVSVRTVDFHFRALYRKTGTKSRSELVARLVER
jgi:DNA-binding CsgD family transcriptional regulator